MVAPFRGTATSGVLAGTGDMLRSGEVPCVPTVTKLPVTLYGEGSAPAAQGLDSLDSYPARTSIHVCRP